MQKMFLFTHLSLSHTYTTAQLHECNCIQLKYLFVDVYIFPPLHLENDFAFDDLFLLIFALQYIFLYNKKPQTWLIMHACSTGCWHIALISIKTEQEELIKCRATLVLLGLKGTSEAWNKWWDLTAGLVTCNTHIKSWMSQLTEIMFSITLLMVALASLSPQWELHWQPPIQSLLRHKSGIWHEIVECRHLL